MTGLYSMPKEVTSPGPTGGFRSSPWTSLLFLAVAVLTCILAYVYLLAPREVFHWDEASYADRALRSYMDLKRHDFKAFLGRVSSPEMMTYGFLHTWLEAAFFLVFGVSYISARSLSLVLFFLSLILIYLISLKLDTQRGWIIGMLAVVFTASSPEILHWATSNMIESASVFMVLLAIFCFFVAIERERPIYYYITGVVMALNFLTKHNYGALLALAFFCLGIWELGESLARGFPLRLKPWLPRYLVIFLGFAIVVGLWLGVTDVRKQIQTLKWEWNYSGMDIDATRVQGPRPSLGTKLLAYPLVLPVQYTFSPWLGYYFLSAVVASFWLVRDKKIRPMLFFIVVSWLLSSVVNVLQARYIITLVPFVFILAGFIPLHVFRATGGKPAARAGILFLVLIYLYPVIADASTVASRVKAYAFAGTVLMDSSYKGEKPSTLKDVLDFFREVIPKERSFSTAVRTHFLSPHTWRIHFHDWKAPYSTSNEFDHGEFLQHDYFVTIEVGESFPYLYEMRGENRLTNLRLWNTYLQSRLAEKSLRIHAVRDFTELDLKGIVYENLLSGAAPARVPSRLPAFLPPMKI